MLNELLITANMNMPESCSPSQLKLVDHFVPTADDHLRPALQYMLEVPPGRFHDAQECMMRMLVFFACCWRRVAATSVARNVNPTYGSVYFVSVH